MTNEISTKLQSLIDKANTTFGMGMDIVLEAYNQAIADKHTPKQAAKILLDNVIAFKKSTIYSFLPDEAKNLTKPKKIPTLESKSSVVEVTTVKDGVNVIAETAKQIAEHVQPPEQPESPHDDKPTDESDDGTEEYHGDAGNNPALIKKYVSEPADQFIDVILDTGKYGGGLFMAVRNSDKCYMRINVQTKEIVKFETAAERRLKQVVKVK